MYTRENKIILIDTTFLFDQYSKRGIGRYGNEILKRLLKVIDEEGGWEIHLIGFLDLLQNLIAIGLTQFSIEEIQSKIHFHSIGTPVQSDIKNKSRWKEVYKPIVDDLDPDIYYAVHFERGLPTTKDFGSGLSKNIKTVVVVHDAIPLINNTFSQKSFFHNILKKRFFNYMWDGVRNADLVLAPSEVSKNDLVQYGKVAIEKIEKIYLGINPFFFRDDADKLDPEGEAEIMQTYNTENKKYFFYDSGLEANKGIDNMLKVFRRILEMKDENLPNYLVITGADLFKGVGKLINPRTENGKWFIKKAKSFNVLDSIISTDKIPDKDLQVLLFNSNAYIYLSNYEGFGFGPLQAMAAKIPAIASNSSCIPEITKGGALLVNPFNTEETVVSISNFLKDQDLQTHLKTAVKIAKEYDWDKTVELTWNRIKGLVVSA